VRFLIDAQLPPALARELGARGHEAEHVADLGLANAPDRAIWDRVIASGAVLVTKDEDFRGHAARQGGAGGTACDARHKRATVRSFGRCAPAWTDLQNDRAPPQASSAASRPANLGAVVDV
jgi:Domain of unknown function (DUF5615)